MLQLLGFYSSSLWEDENKNRSHPLTGSQDESLLWSAPHFCTSMSTGPLMSLPPGESPNPLACMTLPQWAGVAYLEQVRMLTWPWTMAVSWLPLKAEWQNVSQSSFLGL